MIGIVVAMNDELNSSFKKKYKFNIFENKKQKYYIFDVNNTEFVLMFSGIGKTNAAIATTKMLMTFDIDKIFNIGAVGTHKQQFNIFDILLINKFYFLDVDATAFNYQLGQTPGEKEFFESSNLLKDKIINSFNDNLINFKNVNLGTSDSFIHRDNFQYFNNKLFDIVDCFDMESTSIAQVCYKNNIEFCSIKIVSDNLTNEILSNEQFKKTLSDISNKLVDILFMIFELSFNN